jgi:hypothetical protein
MDSINNGKRAYIHIYMLYNHDVLSSITRRERISNKREMLKLARNEDLFFFATIFVKYFFSSLFFRSRRCCWRWWCIREARRRFVLFLFFNITDGFLFFFYLRDRPDERERRRRKRLPVSVTRDTNITHSYPSGWWCRSRQSVHRIKDNISLAPTRATTKQIVICCTIEADKEKGFICITSQYIHI